MCHCSMGCPSQGQLWAGIPSPSQGRRDLPEDGQLPVAGVELCFATCFLFPEVSSLSWLLCSGKYPVARGHGKIWERGVLSFSA